MIKSVIEYRVTKAKQAKLKQFIEEFRISNAYQRQSDPQWYKLQEDTLQSLIDELQTEVNDYEKLTTGKLKAPDLDIVETLPTKLISARLALNWTQKDLADRLKMKHQQIQRYEATDYQTASLRTVCSIAKVLMDASQGKSQRKPASR